MMVCGRSSEAEAAEELTWEVIAWEMMLIKPLSLEIKSEGTIVETPLSKATNWSRSMDKSFPRAEEGDKRVKTPLMF
jgi:hypothetical protein